MIQVLCYGDSNTWGYDPETNGRLPFEERYPGILSALLGPSCHVIEDGLCGRTTQFESDLEPFVNGYLGARFCAEVHAPLDYVVIMLGTNDCKELYAAQVSQIAGGVRRIAKCFEERGAGILILAPAALRRIEACPFFEEFGITAKDKSEQLVSELERLAADEKWMFLNVDALTAPGSTDFVHLDRMGHQKLAQAVYTTLKKVGLP